MMLIAYWLVCQSATHLFRRQNVRQKSSTAPTNRSLVEKSSRGKYRLDLLFGSSFTMDFFAHLMNNFF
jgi:hypothetical protein